MTVSGLELIADRRDHETELPLHERLLHRALRLKARDGCQQVTLAVRRLRRNLLRQTQDDLLIVHDHGYAPYLIWTCSVFVSTTKALSGRSFSHVSGNSRSRMSSVIEKPSGIRQIWQFSNCHAS